MGLNNLGLEQEKTLMTGFNNYAADVMNMSDSLEQLGQLAQAIMCNDLDQIDQACSSIITMYTQAITHPDTAKTFQRWDGTISEDSKYHRPQFSLQEGIVILQKIIDKISNHRAL